MHPTIINLENDCNASGQSVRIGVPYASHFHIPIAGTCVTRVVYPDDALPRLTHPLREWVASPVFRKLLCAYSNGVRRFPIEKIWQRTPALE